MYYYISAARKNIRQRSPLGVSSVWCQNRNSKRNIQNPPGGNEVLHYSNRWVTVVNCAAYLFFFFVRVDVPLHELRDDPTVGPRLLAWVAKAWRLFCDQVQVKYDIFILFICWLCFRTLKSYALMLVSLKYVMNENEATCAELGFQWEDFVSEFLPGRFLDTIRETHLEVKHYDK